MKIVIDIPKEHYNEIVYVNYERLRDIVRDGVVLEECEDAVSREAVIDCINLYPKIIGNRSDLALEIKHLPSVQPQPKRGFWKERHYANYPTWHECSNNYEIENVYTYEEGDAE